MRSTPVLLLAGACLALGALPVAAPAAELPPPQLLADLVPGVTQVALSQAPQPLVAIGSRMLFTAEPATGRDLWSSDGTPQGAERLFTGAGGQGYVGWEQAGAIELLVEPTDYTEGPALFRTDGTAAGTQLVTSWPSAVFMGWLGTSAQRSWFAPCRALSDAYQCELWTVAGAERSATLLAADVGWYHAGLQRQPVAGGRLFFFTGQDQDPDPDRDLELWRSDGTTSSTVRLRAWPPTAAARWLGRRGAEVFFSLHAAGGWEIWKSDGTPRGTRMLRRLRTAEPYLIDFEDDEPRTGPLFFYTYELATRTTELWAITGGAKVRDLGPFRTLREPQRVVDATGKARYLFAATRRNPSPADLHRMRLWVTDGTPGKTAELRGPGGAPVLVERPLGVAAGRYYFAGTDGSPDVEPWVTDGTAAGTRRLADTCPGLCGSELGGVVALGGAVLFVSELAFEQTLWRSDGTSAVPVTTLAGGSVDLGSEAWSVPLGRVAGGRVFFAVEPRRRLRAVGERRHRRRHRPRRPRLHGAAGLGAGAARGVGADAAL